jgi:type IV pilus assembly protein PilA
VVQPEEYCSLQIRREILRFAETREAQLAFCAGCGNNVAAGERFCRVCGKEIPPSAVITLGVPAETSGKAIASLVCGLFLLVFPLSIVAIVFGHISLSEIRKSAGRLKGEGIAIAGLVLGYLGVAGIPIMLIIAAIAIPNLMRARIAANEASAVAVVRTLVVAEAAYSQSHPDAGYTCTLYDLSGAGLIDAGLASGQKNGYAFELQGCNASAESVANTKFRVVAYPLTRNTTGIRAFCSDESGVIRTDGKSSVQDCLESGSTL